MATTVFPLILTLARGSTGQLVIKLREKVDENTTRGYDLSVFTTITITGDTRENPDNASTRLFQKAVATSGLTDAAGGDLELSFVDGDWSAGALSTLTAGCYFIDIWGTDGSGNDTAIIKGIFDFVMDLSKL